jgi:uncharacterized membrane protein required for colicin V production
MTTADILLLLIVAGAFLFGFFWGVIRGLLGLAGFLVVFVLSAHLSDPVGAYLTSQWTQYSAAYDHMLAFLLTFALLYGLTLVLITIGTRGSQDLSRYPLMDDVVGALLGAGLAILCVAAVVAILKTAPAVGLGPEWTANIYQALVGSTFGGQIAGSVAPALVALLGPLMPESVRHLL